MAGVCLVFAAQDCLLCEAMDEISLFCTSMAGVCLVCAAQDCLPCEATDEISLFCTPMDGVCLLVQQKAAYYVKHRHIGNGICFLSGFPPFSFTVYSN
jgi:hypothetical protein